MSTIVELSITAHGRALKYGGPVPAERREFDHLPMVVVGGVPAFDPTRMRPDQELGLIERLLVLGGFVRARKTEEQVHDFMEAFGASGVRLQDVVDDLGVSKRGVLRYLTRLIGVGKVAVREEENPRGNGASARKRYYWVDGGYGGIDPAYLDEAGGGLTVHMGEMRGTGAGEGGSGIIHHGPLGELDGCTCYWCKGAVTDSIFLEAISSARKAGGSGFAEGVAWKTDRRCAEEREFNQQLRRAGLL